FFPLTIPLPLYQLSRLGLQKYTRILYHQIFLKLIEIFFWSMLTRFAENLSGKGFQRMIIFLKKFVLKTLDNNLKILQLL
ncbi:hypothetical protein, partial [Limnovirga soli]|uniref:hypothetical protein n=1 Tax=Limnovirga soli TaxID=2656915 RepID=UPI001C0F0A01